MIEQAYLITLENGIYQICVSSGEPVEAWELELIEKLKESPDFLWLGNGKFIVGSKQ